MIIRGIPYEPNPIPGFSRLLNQRWPILLDSAGLSRYTIYTANPIKAFTLSSTDNPYPLLNSLEKSLYTRQTQQSTPLPFIGGAMGYWSYDLGRQLQNISSQKKEGSALPLLQIGLYDWAIVTDHEKQSSHYVHRYGDEAHWHWLHTLSPTTPTPFKALSSFSPDQSFKDYEKRFLQVKAYLLAGDCYQVNLAQQFSGQYEGDAFSLYQKLREKNPAPYAAFLRFGTHDILSNSPECLLRITGSDITTRPIKGTRPRHPNPLKDKQLAQALRASEKDQAENLMIVDLLRNDLGRCAMTGSVKVPELFKLESYRSVHHLVSKITAKKRPDVSMLQCFLSAFPGGSITGAPKIRAMEIIEELESFQRQIYCGSIGYISDHGHLESNIAIRTLLAHQQQVLGWAGGGLVIDSVLEAEYQETLDKIHLLKKTIEDRQ